MKLIKFNQTITSVFKCTVLVLCLLLSFGSFGYSSPVRLRREIIGDDVVSFYFLFFRFTVFNLSLQRKNFNYNLK